MKIPKQLQNSIFRFILLKKKEKRPIELEWQTKNNYKFNDPKLIKHINSGGNYGIIGGFGNLILIDADSEEINKKCKLLPDTFTVKSCCPNKYKHHYYFIGDEEMSPIRLSKEKLGDIGDIRSSGQYVVCPGSYAIDKKKGYEGAYNIAKDLPISKISVGFVKTIFKDFVDVMKDTDTKNKKDWKIDTTKRFSQFTKNCRVPDFCLNNKLPDNISKNWKLFPYVVDVLNSRDVSDKLYEKLAETQNHELSAVKGWVKSAKEGTLAKTSCKKMRDYLEHYTPELADEICADCPLYKKIKEEKEIEKVEKLKEKLLEEHKEKISKDEEVLEIVKNPNLFNEITETEFDKKIVGEVETRKVIFNCANGRLVKNHQVASYNLLVNDQAGTGKDYVTGSVLSILPKEIYIHKTRISPAVFTYWHNSTTEPDWTWNGKVFYPEDISEGVLNSDVVKVMTSKGSSATIVIKQVATEIEIKGKPVVITTTASATPSPELVRRFVILNLDSSKSQTRAIMKKHSEYAKRGEVPEYNPKYTEAMQLLEIVKVKVPFADLIYLHFPENSIIMRTHYPRFLDFIKSSCAFYQFQREQDGDGFYLATGQDYEIAKNCFLKLCSNKYMIPLTINQKNILKIFGKEPFLQGSASKLHSSKMNFMALKNLQDNLQKLVTYGILQTKIEADTYGRDIEVYVLSKSYNPNEKMSLPSFNELGSVQSNEVSKVSKILKVSKVSKVSKGGDGYLTYDAYPSNRLKEAQKPTKNEEKDNWDTFHKKENTQQLPDFHKSGMEKFRKK